MSLCLEREDHLPVFMVMFVHFIALVFKPYSINLTCEKYITFGARSFEKTTQNCNRSKYVFMFYKKDADITNTLLSKMKTFQTK